jgi:hypothetical protein
LISALPGGERSASRPGRFTPGERAHGSHWIGGGVDPRAGLEDVEKRKFLILPGLELRPFDRPVRSQSLYRLSYPDSTESKWYVEVISAVSEHSDDIYTKPLVCNMRKVP